MFAELTNIPTSKMQFLDRLEDVMALKNQVANVYGVGINNVGSYQVAGRPFA